MIGSNERNTRRQEFGLRTRMRALLDANYNLYSASGACVWYEDEGNLFFGENYEMLVSHGYIDAQERDWIGNDPKDYWLIDVENGQQYRYDLWIQTLRYMKELEQI